MTGPSLVRVPVPGRLRNTLSSSANAIETSSSSGSSSGFTMSDRNPGTSQEFEFDYSVSSSSSSGRSTANISRALYSCRVVHPCNPPDGVAYRNLPFFTLLVDEVFEVLKEFGHPSLHQDLPLYVDGKDCLLLIRDRMGSLGWTLASFLKPLGKRRRQTSAISPSSTLEEAQEPG